MITGKNSEWYQVVDNKTGKVVARGPVVGYKSNNPGHRDIFFISVDGKWYFNCRCEEFEVTLIDPGQSTVEFTNPDDYHWLHWQNWQEPLPPLYRDFCIDEVDPEVKDLVIELNKWCGVETTGSCCGHGRGPLWIQLQGDNTRSLNCIFNVLRAPEIFPKLLDRFKFSIESKYIQCMNYYAGHQTLTALNNSTHMDKHSIISSPFLHLVLMTTTIGEEAYHDAQLLARYLAEIREQITEQEGPTW
jgi:hypothetical protein